MIVLVALENRFLKCQDGNFYSTTVCDYSFFSRYLQIFDGVVVFARVMEIPDGKIDKPCANGPHVRFLSVPQFIGPWVYLRKHYKVNTVAKQSVQEADAFILRVPGTMATVIWKQLMRKKLPYGVEVVGDPWDSLAPSNVKSFLLPFLRKKASSDMATQCSRAEAASYVTEYSLQRRYPPGYWYTHYSSVELSLGDIASDPLLEDRACRIKDKILGGLPVRICHVGMMEHLYKAPDTLINSIDIVTKRGMNVELVMVGDGKFKDALQKKANDLGIGERAKFLGKVSPGKSVYEVLDNADLYVLPSRQEGLPRSLIEAMARGLPCIASNIGGIPELLDDDFMVVPGDAQALADKIIWALGDVRRLTLAARVNREKAKDYISDTLNKRRVEFYRKVAEGCKRENSEG